jgi:hypothetical protein
VATILGRDLKARVAARFAGRLRTVTIARAVGSAVNPAAPSGPPLSTTATYTADGASFGYEARDVDGESIKIGDYRVTVMLGSVLAVADDAVAASLDLGAETVNADTVIAALVSGAGGNEITVELVGDAVTQAGTLVEHGTNVRIGYLPGSTTVADLEALLATSALVEVLTPGTGATVLLVGDALAATPLAGGLAATTAIAGSFTPAVGDLVTCPPPGSSTSKTARAVALEVLTEAFATVRVRGAGA